MPKTFAELTEPECDANAMVWIGRFMAGELEHIQRDVQEALRSGRDPRGFFEELVELLGARIEKHDESGEGRAWSRAWREAEATAGPARGIALVHPSGIVHETQGKRVHPN